MRLKKVPMSIYVTAEQKRRLDALHARTEVPVSAYIRRGIEMVLKKEGA
ncbi:MAG: ribbon-helix-helix domain-containing protein [Deltaproteobacteria bacterium]|nr:ribbon-helix-helix domain-containing protein [Deltaproteobacteria bacterium]